MTSRTLLVFLLGLVSLSLAGISSAQQLLIDQGVRAADLWCFPLASDPDTWVYLPGQASLARDTEGRGQLSFIRYVDNTAGSGSDGPGSITRAEGGALLHFLVQYETPPEQVRAAEAELRRSLGVRSIRLARPVVFREGRYALVSSVLLGGSEERRTSVLATGRAPVLEGNRIAFSFDLEPARAELLQKSLSMAVSDVSVVFDLAFAGLTDAYDAQLVIDWQKVQRSEYMKKGASFLFVAADVERSLDELRLDNAIRLTSQGSDATSEALIDNIYTKLLDLIYTPVEPEEAAREQPEILDRIVEAGTRLFGLGARSAYRVKATRSEGTTVLNFDSAVEVERRHLITLNLADLRDRYGIDPEEFETLNLADPTFRQRRIHVAPDGLLRSELGRSINNVVVTLRKEHASGPETRAEIFVNADVLSEGAALQPFLYPWREGGDSGAWLRYSFRALWSFEGGGQYDTDWVTTDAGVISLSPPFRRSTVLVLGSEEELVAAGVRTVVVVLEHSFFGERRAERVILRPSRWKDESPVELLLPVGAPTYDYSIEWFLEDGQRRSASGTERSGILFVDDVPQA